MKYASPRFLNSISFFFTSIHFYKIGIDYENLPNKFNAAALLLYKCIDIYTLLGSPEIIFNASLQVLRHYLGLFCSKYKYVKYYAAEKLLGEYFNDAYNIGIAFFAGIFNDYAKRISEFVYF